MELQENVFSMQIEAQYIGKVFSWMALLPFLFKNFILVYC